MILAPQKLHAQVDCPRWSHPPLEPFGMLGHHFWRLQCGMPSSIMLCQQRDVGSSLFAIAKYSCASMAQLEWNMSEYSTTAADLEQAVQVRRPWWEVFEKFGNLRLSHSSGSGSKAQGLDHACPLGPGARSARLLFSVLGLKRFGLSHSSNLTETLCTDASFSQGKQVSVPMLLRMKGRLSPERACWGMLNAQRLVWQELGGFTWEALA